MWPICSAVISFTSGRSAWIILFLKGVLVYSKGREIKNDPVCEPPRKKGMFNTYHTNIAHGGTMHGSPSAALLTLLAPTRRKRQQCHIGNKKVSNIENAKDGHEQLIARVASGRDKLAFKAIFTHFAPRLKSYLLKYGLEGQRAEDIVQEVMVIVWRKADTFDPTKAKFSTWLFRIARNKFIDHTRRHKYPEVSADDHLAEIAAADRTDQHTETRQTSEKVRAALASLNKKQSEVIELSFFKEMSHSEIAEQLDLPLGTVKSRIRKAFTVLRAAIGDQI